MPMAVLEHDSNGGWHVPTTQTEADGGRTHTRISGRCLQQPLWWKEMLKPMCQNSKEIHRIFQHFWCNKWEVRTWINKQQGQRKHQAKLWQQQEECAPLRSRSITAWSRFVGLPFWAQYLQDTENNSQPNWSRNYLLSLGLQNGPGKTKQ